MFRSNRPMTLAVAATVAAFLPLGCFGGDQADEEEADFENVREGLEQMAEGLGQTAEGIREAVEGMAEGMVEEPVNFRVFYDLFPDEIGDFERVSREGQSSGMAGMNISTAEAEYERSDGATLRIEITDVGAVAGPALLGMAAWMNINLDRETRNGWERTTEYRDYPAYEEFTRSDEDRGRGELTYIVERRFIVEVSGSRVTWDELEEARDEIGTRELADMKDDEG